MAPESIQFVFCSGQKDASLLQRALAGTGWSGATVQRIAQPATALQLLQRCRHTTVAFVSFEQLADCGVQPLLRAASRCPAVSWIVLCRRDQRQMAERLLQQGIDELLIMEELDAPVLQRAVHSSLQRARLRRETRALRQLLALKNQRLARMYQTAHELVDHLSRQVRTPLTVLQEFAALIRDQLAGPITEQQKQLLDAMLTRTDDIARMVDDLVDISRLEAAMVRAHRRACQVGPIVQRVRQQLERRIDAKQIDFQLAVPEQLPELFCDPDLAYRALINLATNAVQFVRDGGCVHLWAAADDAAGTVRIGVADDEPGIDQQELDRIARLFHQAKISLDAGRTGLGPGLGIARELAKLNLGTIQLESRPDAGSAIAITLPVNRPAAIAKNYLRHVSALPAGPTHVCLLQLQPTSALAPQDFDRCTTFLQETLRAHDLVIPAVEQGWLVAAATSRLETATLVERLRQRCAADPARCPGGIHIDVLGNWAVAEEAEQFAGMLVAGWRRPAGQKRHPPRVLVIDDDAHLAHGLRLRLQTAGYDVVTASNGQQAVMEAANHRPDAIVLDDSPDADKGLSTLQQLRQHDQTKDTPVIVLSASVRDQQRALAHGAQCFLQKPYEASAVVSAVRSSLSGRPDAPSPPPAASAKS